jgi:gluconate kinase
MVTVSQNALGDRRPHFCGGQDLAVLSGQLAALEPLTSDEQGSALTIDTDAPQAPQRLLEAVRALGVEP